MAIVRPMAVFNLGVLAGFAVPQLPPMVVARRADASSIAVALFWAVLLGVLPVLACRRERLFWFACLHVGAPAAIAVMRAVA